MEVPVLLVEFEGVLAETATLRGRALAESLASDGIELNASLLHLASGHTTEDAIRLIRDAVGAPDDQTAIELARLRADRVFAERAGKGLAVQPQLRETLERLTSVARLALVTRASRREVQFVLALAGLDAYFRPVITQEDVAPAKPARAAYAAALKRVAELFPGQVLRGIAIEDSVVAVRTAREMGLLTVIVGAVQPHEAMEADSWIETIADLTPERVRAIVGHAPKGSR